MIPVDVRQWLRNTSEMSDSRKGDEDIEPFTSELEEPDGDASDGEETIDLDEFEPTTLWHALARYTTEIMDDDEWIDPDLLPVYTIVLSNLAQIVARLTNEPPDEFGADEDDECTS
jgi:hypothetical protein